MWHTKTTNCRRTLNALLVLSCGANWNTKRNQIKGLQEFARTRERERDRTEKNKSETRRHSGVCVNLRFIFNWIETQEQTNSIKMKLWKSKKNQNNNNGSPNGNNNGNSIGNGNGNASSTSCVPGKSSNLAKANECNKLDSSAASSSTGNVIYILEYALTFTQRVYVHGNICYHSRNNSFFGLGRACISPNHRRHSTDAVSPTSLRHIALDARPHHLPFAVLRLSLHFIVKSILKESFSATLLRRIRPNRVDWLGVGPVDLNFDFDATRKALK